MHNQPLVQGTLVWNPRWRELRISAELTAELLWHSQMRVYVRDGELILAWWAPEWGLPDDLCTIEYERDLQEPGRLLVPPHLACRLGLPAEPATYRAVIGRREGEHYQSIYARPQEQRRVS